MKGFFTRKETESLSSNSKVIHSCASCGLYKFCNSPKMKPTGNFAKGIMCIGEFPDYRDDEENKHWQSLGGRLLQLYLDKAGIDLHEDCISLNAVNCAPPDRPPTNMEIAHCRSVVVWKAVLKYQPKLILLFGSAAVESIIGHRMKGGFNKYRGWVIPDQDLAAWVVPLMSPNYLVNQKKPDDLMNIWSTELTHALSHLNKRVPKYPKPKIEIVDNLDFLNNHTDKLTAFDYETTGLKPHAKAQKIVCVSISDCDNKSYVFFAPKNKRKWLPFRKWLNNRRSPKMAHNIKYEDAWSRVKLKVPVKNWAWDSMLAAHVIDNRTGITSLKFQNYVNFGITDYSEDIAPYLKTKDDSGNAINDIQKLVKTKTGREQLAEYCGLDSVYEYRLAIKQMEALDWNFLPF